MADPVIKFKRSSVAGKVPTISQLPLGELAINTYDGKIFLKQDTNGVGIATTVKSINPWDESYGGGSISYQGNVTISGLLTTTSLNVGLGATINGLTYPTTDGSQNQVLATDGSGQLQFVNISQLQSFNWGNDSDFGLIIESITASGDSGLIISSVSDAYDLGTLIITGTIYPDVFVLPSFTVSTLPSASNQAGQMLFVTDETGGSVPAFSDGTNWRRVTDRQIVS